jgi:phenylacetate-CoA ligase
VHGYGSNDGSAFCAGRQREVSGIRNLTMTYAEYLHPAVETMSPADVAEVQRTKWTQQWDYLRSHSAFYQRKLAAKVGRQIALDDLQDVALTDKEELRVSQESDYPYGDYIACPKDKIVRIHRTSGTTGRALILANSQKDVDIVTQQGGRSMYCAGLRPGDRVVHCLNYQLWTGGLTDHMTLEATGATTIPFGVGGTKLLLQTIMDLGVTAISSTPSYLALLEKILREDLKKNPRDLNLRLGLFGGEAGLDNQEFRDRIESTWGLKVRNANFGLSEVMSNMASQCDHTHDLHMHSKDVLFIEILDPKTGERLPMKEGTTGEFVCTHIEKDCQPLVRYRTRDVITVTGTGPCKCGRATWRFRVSGRTDDMFNVRGVNVFPSAIQKVVTGATTLCSGHFRIVLDGPGPYDRVVVKAEAAERLPPEQFEEAAHSLEKKIKDVIGASAKVVLIPFESLGRTDGKTSLIVRV